MALNIYADCVDVFLRDRLILVDVVAYHLVSKKDGSFNSVIKTDCSVTANTVKDASFSCVVPIQCGTQIQSSMSVQICSRIGIVVNVKPYTTNESVSIESIIGVLANANATAVRHRTLSDLNEVMLSDINDMTLHELYWIEK